MRRAAIIFVASIVLPSLVLAWLAVHSAQDQQVVLEHQQVIISQNLTDALARNVQVQMEQQRLDFVAATQQLLVAGPSPQAVAGDFNRRIRAAWPMAEVGFAVDLSGHVYSPQLNEGPGAKIFRNENDRFLGNLENVAVYNSRGNNFAQNETSNASSGIQEYRTRDEADKDLLKKVEVPRSIANAAQSSGNAAYSKLSAPAAATTAETKLAGATLSLSEPPLPQQKAVALPSVADAATADQMETMAHLARKSDGASSLQSATPATKRAIAMGGAITAAPAPAPAAAPANGPVPLSAPGGVSEASAAATSPLPATPAALDQLTVNTNAATQNNLSLRNVIPQQQSISGNLGNLALNSASVAEQTDFRRVIGSDTSGELARFLDNNLRLLVWSHPDGQLVYGAQINRTKLVQALATSFQIPEMEQVYPISSLGERGRTPQYCVAILDDMGSPVALSASNFFADWKHPFVSTEIGDALPHWEAALYLVNPDQFGHQARVLQLTIALIVLVLVAAIALGGWIIASDVQRQVRLAQQKTDFVSNVSHELKTPLTSIRMFADLLAEKRVPDEEKQSAYLRIIAAEASRLTRLINNVLDFARLEKNKPPGEHHDCDLAEAARDVAGTCEPHLEAGQIKFQLEVESEPLPIRGDRDALAQVILNLISNAEKYGGGDILVRVRRQEMPGGALGCVDVLDRGAGIPPREAKAIFEPFHRLEESLANGVPGTGLGLTLARRMARGHGGDVTYSARAGGGSCFTLSVPLTNA